MQSGQSEKLGVVLLAAGGSRRLGQPKQLVQIDGESLVVRTARRLISLEPACLVVVTGASTAEVTDQLNSLPVQPVFNPDWKLGMGTSIALGLSQLPHEAEGVLIMLCDQWRVDSNDLKSLAERWKVDISRIIASRWIDSETPVYGPPAIFPRKLFHVLSELNGDRGARSIIGKHLDLVEFVALENAAADLDVPGDLQRIFSAGTESRQRD